MKHFRQSLGYLIAGILLYFLIKPFVAIHSHLKDTTFEIQWGWLVCSFAAILFYWSAYLYPFATLLSGLMRKQVPFCSAFTLFHRSNITRYLPGRIWGVVRLFSLSKQYGLSKTAVGSSLTLHVGIETALGGLIAMSLLFSKQVRNTAIGILEKLSAHTLLLALAVIGILTGILFCLLKLTSRTRQVLKTLVPLLGNTGLWGNVILSHCLLWICQGFAFFLFVRSFVPMPWTAIGLFTSCFAFAWIVGFLSFLTPGGLGVREGLLGLLLTNYMSAPQATLIALLCRVWMLSAEVILAAVAFFLSTYSNRTQKKIRMIETVTPHVDLNETRLIDRTQQGDTEAFGPLVEKYQPRVYTHIHGRIKDAEVAKDLTQEAWFKALRAIKSFRGDAVFSSWLYRIAENVCLDYFRKQKARTEMEPLHDIEERHIRETSPCPSQEVLRQELRDTLKNALDCLTKSRREVFVLLLPSRLAHQSDSRAFETF